MTKNAEPLLWLLFYLTKKKVRSWLQRREEKGCYHSLFKEPLVSKFCHHVFSCHGYKLSSINCNIWNNYKLSSKIIITFHFVAGNLLQTMGHVEIILNSVVETYFCCCNTATKSKRFYYTAATIFAHVTSSKNLFETTWVQLYCFFRACNATYYIISAKNLASAPWTLKQKYWKIKWYSRTYW